MINDNDKQIKLAKKLLSSEVELVVMPIDDSWARDTMATFVYEDESVSDNLIPINWQFNAWGEKFKPFNHDQNQVNYLAKKYHWQIENSKLILEGGSIHSNGNGVLLTTKECLIDAKRNANCKIENIEKTLSHHLNCHNILWLPYGIANDIDTDGHIDNVACFINEQTILIQSCHDKHDENFKRHQANLDYLKTKPFDLVELPQPEKRSYKGEPLALSYLNFYITNDQIIMPTFDQQKQDANAKAILTECFPSRKITLIDSAITIAQGGGGIHCITMQQPKGAIKCA